MAIVVEAVSVVEVESNASNITLTEPSGTVQDDLLVAVIGSDAGVNPTELSSNTGWTEIVNGSTSGRNCDLIVEYLVRGASAPDLTWDFSGSQEAIGIMYRISGYDSSDPIGSSAITDGSTTTPTAPSITTGQDNSRVIVCYSSDDGSRLTNAEDTDYPSSTTGRFRRDTEGSGGITGGAADFTQVSAGSTGTSVWPALNASKEWFAATIEVNAIAGTAGNGASTLLGVTAAGTGGESLPTTGDGASTLVTPTASGFGGEDIVGTADAKRAILIGM